MSAWLGLFARKSWKRRVPSEPSAVIVRVDVDAGEGAALDQRDQLVGDVGLRGGARGGARAVDARVDLRVAVLVQQRVARRCRGRSVAPWAAITAASWPSAAVAPLAPCVPSATWLCVSTLPWSSVNRMFVLSSEALVGERGEQLAEARVVVLDDRGDLRAVGPGRGRSASSRAMKSQTNMYAGTVLAART